MLRSESEAEDATQETFLRMHRSFDTFDPTRPMTPWVARTAYNAPRGREWDPGDRAQAYLDGALSPDETLAFERELSERPEVGRALAEALVLRDLLRVMPPLAPPPGLEERSAARLLGPLAPGGAHPPARPPRPLWKRALGVGG